MKTALTNWLEPPYYLFIFKYSYPSQGEFSAGQWSAKQYKNKTKKNLKCSGLLYHIESYLLLQIDGIVSVLGLYIA